MRTFAAARASYVRNPTFSLLQIEDDPLWRGLVSSIASSLPNLNRFLSVNTGADEFASARSFRPDVVILDLRLPDMGGLEISRQLDQLPGPPRTLLLSARTDDALLHRASQPHIAGLLWKTPEIRHLLPEALAAVVAGRKYFSPAVSTALRRMRADPSAFYKILSDRELDLIPYFGLAFNDQEIADRLCLNQSTIRSHRQRVMQKLGVHRSIDLINWSIRTGLVPPPR